MWSPSIAFTFYRVTHKPRRKSTWPNRLGLVAPDLTDDTLAVSVLVDRDLLSLVGIPKQKDILFSRGSEQFPLTGIATLLG